MKKGRYSKRNKKANRILRASAACVRAVFQPTANPPLSKHAHAVADSTTTDDHRRPGIAPAEYTEITLNKHPWGFKFPGTSWRDDAQGIPEEFGAEVTQITASGRKKAYLLEKGLRLGDRIVSVNGESVVNAPHKKILTKMLKFPMRVKFRHYPNRESALVRKERQNPGAKTHLGHHDKHPYEYYGHNGFESDPSNHHPLWDN